MDIWYKVYKFKKELSYSPDDYIQPIYVYRETKKYVVINIIPSLGYYGPEARFSKDTKNYSFVPTIEEAKEILCKVYEDDPTLLNKIKSLFPDYFK